MNIGYITQQSNTC